MQERHNPTNPLKLYYRYSKYHANMVQTEASGRNLPQGPG